MLHPSSRSLTPNQREATRLCRLLACHEFTGVYGSVMTSTKLDGGLLFALHHHLKSRGIQSHVGQKDMRHDRGSLHRLYALCVDDKWLGATGEFGTWRQLGDMLLSREGKAKRTWRFSDPRLWLPELQECLDWSQTAPAVFKQSCGLLESHELLHALEQDTAPALISLPRRPRL